MVIRAIIPARIGSKGVIKKNLREVGNKTLIERSITTAKKSEIFSEIIVTSDSSEILEISKSHGVTAYKRPANISGDSSTAKDVVKNLMDNLTHEVKPDDIFLYLQPSSPFTSTKTLCELSLMLQTHSIPIFTARLSDPIEKILNVDKQMTAEPLFENSNPTGNRQSGYKTFIATGGCYAFTAHHFRQSKDVPVLGAKAFVVSWPEDFDIDTEQDLEIANMIATMKGL